eukprot:PITA_34459
MQISLCHLHQADECFKNLKKVIATTPVLATPDFSKPFIVECDASTFRIGPILMQDNHPIAFESMELNKRASLKSTYQKEMLAIIHALTKWQKCLLGTFDLEILRKKGKENVVADALSWKDDDNTTCTALAIVPDWLDKIRVEYAKDLDYRAMIENISQYANYEWKNDILWYKRRIYLTPSSKFRMKILKESHNSPTAGHVGVFKTYYKIRQSFYWKGMGKKFQKYVTECDVCQRNKGENIPTSCLLQPLHIPNQTWEEISMDFVEGLPISEGKDKIFVLVNRLTKYAHFMGIKKTDTTKQIAEEFCKNIYKLHGFPKVIVSHRDAKFKGNFWKYFCHQAGISLNMSSSYHPPDRRSN